MREARIQCSVFREQNPELRTRSSEPGAQNPESRGWSWAGVEFRSCGEEVATVSCALLGLGKCGRDWNGPRSADARLRPGGTGLEPRGGEESCLGRALTPAGIAN